jgi:hypothetical protein
LSVIFQSIETMRPFTRDNVGQYNRTNAIGLPKPELFASMGMLFYAYGGKLFEINVVCRFIIYCNTELLNYGYYQYLRQELTKKSNL